jgi:hypothetical protein
MDWRRGFPPRRFKGPLILTFSKFAFCEILFFSFSFPTGITAFVTNYTRK